MSQRFVNQGERFCYICGAELFDVGLGKFDPATGKELVGKWCKSEKCARAHWGLFFPLMKILGRANHGCPDD